MKYTYVEEKVESKSEKRIRIFLVVMFFLQILLTTTAFMWDPQTGQSITPLLMLIQTNGYSNSAEFMMGVYGGILVLFPLVAFFFCLLDKKSKKKYLVSTLCVFTTVIMICFLFRANLAAGAILTLIVNIITMFMTSQGFQATRMRESRS